MGQVLEDQLCLKIEQAVSCTVFPLCLLQQQQKGQGGRRKKKKKKVSRLAGSLDILPAWFGTVSPSLVSVRERNAVMKQGSLPTPRTFQPLSTRLFPCWGWTRFLLFSMTSPAWLLVVWWIKGHSCFNWLDFQLINSQVVFAALLALDSPYGICNKKIPFSKWNSHKTRGANTQEVCYAESAAKWTTYTCSLIFQLQYFLVLLFWQLP